MLEFIIILQKITQTTGRQLLQSRLLQLPEPICMKQRQTLTLLKATQLKEGLAGKAARLIQELGLPLAPCLEHRLAVDNYGQEKIQIKNRASSTKTRNQQEKNC